MLENTEKQSKKNGRIVRDKMPEIYKAMGKEVELGLVTGTRLQAFLRLRLWERARDLAKATTKDGVVDHCSEILELMAAILREEDISAHEVQALAAKKNKDEGAFTQGILVVESLASPLPLDSTVAYDLV